ncbi:MAG: hypothetical protein ABF679_02190 [Lentilactobacillus diolivorans]|uniref:hypothetical protein n=1 Tax=Lentilactobacillus diolivorans TaxID=179838 RepID=UPI0039EA80C8
MPFLAILLDCLTLGAYFFQLHFGSPFIYVLGIGLQIIVTLIQLGFCFSYKGKRYRNPWIFGIFKATIPYSIIIASTAVNGIIVIMYGFNLFGINSVIFSG